MDSLCGEEEELEGCGRDGAFEERGVHRASGLHLRVQAGELFDAEEVCLGGPAKGIYLGGRRGRDGELRHVSGWRWTGPPCYPTY